MKNKLTTILGIVFIALCVNLSFINSSLAEENGRYTIIQAPGNSESWILDTQTGKVRACVYHLFDEKLICTPWSDQQ